MATYTLPTLKINAVLLHIERAIFVKENCKFDKKAHIEIERSGKRVEFYVQAIDAVNKVDLTSPVLKKTFESVDGTSTEPIWTTNYSGECTNGDIWVPIEDDRSSLTLKVFSGHFVSMLNIDLTKEKGERMDYDLFDEQGKKLDGSALRMSYELGTFYEIEFDTGDVHFSPGTGTETLFLNNISPNASVIFANLYKRLKRFNPFGIGQQSTEKGEDTEVLFQINGLGSRSRFYICKEGKHGQHVVGKPERKSIWSKYRYFVPSSVGAPLSISLRIVYGHDMKATWFLEKVKLRTIGGSEMKELVMPCYQWITEGRMKTISLPFSFLPQTIKNDPNFEHLRLERLNELEVTRSKYQWDRQFNIPSYLRGVSYGAYDLVPLDEKFDDYKSKDFSYLVSKGLQNAAINFALNKFCPLNHVEDYQNLYNLIISNAVVKPASIIDKWTDDAFFGWTILAGTNPTHITLCKSVPPQYLREKEICKDDSGNPLNLEEECSNGRLFYVDYSGLAKYNLHTEGVQSEPQLQNGRKYASPATCLLYVANDGKLRPIAIQLLPDGPIFTPRDTKWQWMYAKMAVHNADAQYHQISDHFLQSHAISETFSIALHRSLSRVHPLYRLLIPHLKYTLAINANARKTLVNPGGFASTLASIGDKLPNLLVDEYTKIDFTKLDFPSRLEQQGFSKGTKGALVEFPYLDDGLLVWEAMLEFVGQYIRLYYLSDSDVVGDSELEDFMRELRVNGNPSHVMPEIRTITQLQQFMTTIMWICSCHHSVVNFNQFMMYGFIPNYPLGLFRPPPTNKEHIDEKFIMDSLPNGKTASIQIALMNVLSSYADNEEYLMTERYMEMIGEEKALKCLEEYRKRLAEIDTQIKERNKERVNRGFYEYTLLMPSRVPNSIAI